MKEIMKAKFFILMALGYSITSSAAGTKGCKPFILNGTYEYATLQEAIDAADTKSSSTISIKPCPEGVNGYDETYSTNILANRTANGGEVFTRCKSLTIKASDKGAHPVLKNFVIVFETKSGIKPDYTVSNLAFSGKSIIIVDNAHGSFGKIEVSGCKADVTNSTSTFQKLKNNDSVGATYSSGTFMQWMQRSTGTTEEFLFHDNEIVARLATKGGSIRMFNGGMMTKRAGITNNVFGSTEHPVANEDGWVMVSQCTAPGAVIEFSGNTIYQHGYGALVWILATGVRATGIDIAIHDNRVNLDNVDRPRFNGDDMLAFFPRNYEISGKVRTWHNYINGFCFNEVLNSAGTALTVDKQIGHTYGDGHVHRFENSENALIRKYGTKQKDIYHFDKADAFDGKAHSSPTINMGQEWYCDRCDSLLAAITIKCKGLKNGESAFFKIKNKNGHVLQTVSVTGGTAQSVSQTIVALAPGHYSVTPLRNEWSWTYNAPGKKEKDIKSVGESSCQEEFSFEFDYTKKEDISMKSAESFKENELF